MVNGSKLPSIEGDRALAPSKAISEAVQDFTLSAADSATLMSLLVSYGPYANGETALFWNIVGLIGRCREVVQAPEPEGGCND